MASGVNRKISAASARAHTRKSKQSSFRLPSGGCYLIFSFNRFLGSVFHFSPFLSFFFHFSAKVDLYFSPVIVLYCFSNCLHNQIERSSDQNGTNLCGKASF